MSAAAAIRAREDARKPRPVVKAPKKAAAVPVVVPDPVEPVEVSQEAAPEVAE